MNSFTCLYSYHDIFYTGTQIQPDTLSLFIKKRKDEDFLVYNAEPIANILGKWAPIVGSFTGIIRIVNSVKSIFENLSNDIVSESKDLWNSFKNLFRGIAELCPFSGIFLVIFDSVRNSFSVHSNIDKEILNQENIAGVAIEGKVIFTLDLAKLENCKVNKSVSSIQQLVYLKSLSLDYLKTQEKNKTLLKMTEIFSKLKEVIEQKNLSI